MANETPSRPPPLMANAIKNFHFDFLKPSLSSTLVETIRAKRTKEVATTREETHCCRYLPPVKVNIYAALLSC